MAEQHFLTPLHTRTKRNYLQRVTDHDKAECAEVATKWGKDYWDGDRRFGYGGYHYDGRWAPFAKTLLDHYQLGPGSKVLDIGCGKAFLLYEMKKIEPQLDIVGLDISDYALANAPADIQAFLQCGSATNLPFDDNAFDFVFSIMTLHNFPNYHLKACLQEINRVMKQKAYIVVESFRNEREKVNLLYWQLTCRAFLAKDEWAWLFKEYGYSGDWELMYFE